MHFKNSEGKPERKNPRRTISVSGRFGLSQMVSKLDTARCANEEADPQGGEGVDMRRCVRTLGLEWGWIGGVLKSSGEGSKGKIQRGQYLLVIGLSCHKWYQS